MNAVAASAQRREALQRRCDQQREQLAQAFEAVQARLYSIDRVTLAVRKLRLVPILLAVIATAVATTPLFRNLSRGLMFANAIKQLLQSRWLRREADSERSAHDSTDGPEPRQDP